MALKIYTNPDEEFIEVFVRYTFPKLYADFVKSKYYKNSEYQIMQNDCLLINFFILGEEVGNITNFGFMQNEDNNLRYKKAKEFMLENRKLFEDYREFKRLINL